MSVQLTDSHDSADDGGVSSHTSSSNPDLMKARVFLGKFPADKTSRQEVEEVFKVHGNLLGISLHKSYGFLQFAEEADAKKCVAAWDKKMFKGQILDVNMASERRKEKDMNTNPAGKPFKPVFRGKRGHPQRNTRGRSDYDMHFRETRRAHRRSPSPDRIAFEARMRRIEIEQMRRFAAAPPPLDPFFDMMRDPYLRPRDDPYDIPFDHLPPPPPWSLPPPPPRAFRREPSPDWVRPREEPEPAYRPPPPRQRSLTPPPRPLPPAKPKPVDMKIIVVNTPQRDYGYHVKTKFSRLGLHVIVIQLSPTVSLANALDETAESGILYAVIISNQNEQHQSVTLTILHGRNPQEHKNMPLDDAIGLVERDYERYCHDLHLGNVPSREPVQVPDVSNLLTKAASGEQLRPEQLDMVIQKLQKQKSSSVVERPFQGRFGAGSDYEKPSQGRFGAGDERPSQGRFGAGEERPSQGRFGAGDERPSQGRFGAGDERPSQGRFGAGEERQSQGYGLGLPLRQQQGPSVSKASIESQQADLQAKILSLLGSSAVVPQLGGAHSSPRTSVQEEAFPNARNNSFPSAFSRHRW